MIRITSAGCPRLKAGKLQFYVDLGEKPMDYGEFWELCRSTERRYMAPWAGMEPLTLPDGTCRTRQTD